MWNCKEGNTQQKWVLVYVGTLIEKIVLPWALYKNPFF